METEIKKLILPIAGRGTRFLPLSMAVPKHLWPIIDRPMIEYALKEARESGIEEIVFVTTTKNDPLLNYLKPDPALKKLLKKHARDHLLKEIEELELLLKQFSIDFAFQEVPKGDGDAILQGFLKIGKEACGVIFCDDIIESKTPALLQLIKIFQTSQRPVIGLTKVEKKEKLSLYGVVEVEKIANRVFKIRKIVEKPKPEEAPSDLAIVGRYILNYEVCEYLKEAQPNKKGEVILAEVLQKMLDGGKTVYGYEVDGKWLECGTKEEWMKTNIYFSLKSEKYGQELKKFIKENKLI